MSAIRVENIRHRQSSDDSISIASDSTVTLKHSNATKLATSGTGVTVTGTCTATAFSGDGSGLTGLSSGVTSDSAFNTVGGTGAGNSIDTSVQYPADENTIFGYRAGYNLTNDDNVLIGFKAGETMVDSFRNIAIGYEAMLEADGSTYSNIGIGRHACKVVNQGHTNVAVGDSALKALGHADYNVAIGGDALEACTTGSNIVAVGYRAGHSVTTGQYSVFVGHKAGQGSTTEEYNCIIGHEAASDATITGGNNTIIGTGAGLKLTSGQRNCIMGNNTAYEITTGINNTSLGTFSGYSLTTGGNNTFIGYSAGYFGSPSGTVTTGSNIICLGDGNVTDLYCQDTSISSSDARDKTDITSFNIGLAWVEALRPVTYRWDRRIWYGEDDKSFGTPDGSKKRSRLHIGFLAQEALEVEKANGYGTSNDDSLVVHLNEDETAYGMKYERLVPILVNAIKELSARVKTLEGG